MRLIAKFVQDSQGRGIEAHGARAWHDADPSYMGNGTKVGIIDYGFAGFSRVMGSEPPLALEELCWQC